MRNYFGYGVVTLATFMLPLLPLQNSLGSEIPPQLGQSQVLDRAQAAAILEHAGLPSDDAAAKATSLDRMELAELSHSDTSQKGGDVIVAIVVIGAIVFLVYLAMEHVNHV